MPKKNKQEQEEPDFIRKIRESAIPKYWTASSHKAEPADPSTDSADSANKESHNENCQDTKEIDKELGDFDIDTVHDKIFGKNGGNEVAPVTMPTDVTTPKKAKLSNGSNQIEAIEVTKAVDVIDVAEVSKVGEKVAEDISPKDETPHPKLPVQKENFTASTAKATRISAKMRKATRAEFREAYTGKTDTKGGKPISIAPAIIERLYRLCSLTGDRNACPTYVINNLLSEFLDAVEPEAKKWGLLD